MLCTLRQLTLCSCLCMDNHRNPGQIGLNVVKRRYSTWQGEGGKWCNHDGSPNSYWYHGELLFKRASNCTVQSSRSWSSYAAPLWFSPKNVEWDLISSLILMMISTEIRGEPIDDVIVRQEVSLFFLVWFSPCLKKPNGHTVTCINCSRYAFADIHSIPPRVLWYARTQACARTVFLSLAGLYGLRRDLMLILVKY